MSQPLQNRKIIIIAIMSAIIMVYLARLFYLQVIDDSYQFYAERNALRHITEYPARGLIYDRYDSLIVYNEAAYDLMVVPNELREFDTIDLCRTLDITKEELERRITKATTQSYYHPFLFEQQMSKQDYGYLQEKLYKFPGFFVQNRTLRYYPHQIAAHVLGYVGEADQKQLDKDSYYQLGDYVGISGIEKAYEEELRGVKGKRVVMVDVHNREKGSYQDGEYDRIALSGKNLWCTLDLELQEYGEKLMKNKRGSIVAIEPSTGEILCIVSSPSYDPNLLVGTKRGKNYYVLMKDSIRKPLFNRALTAIYPPGSIFKLANALIGQQEGVITASTVYGCPGGYSIGNKIIKCHHAGSTNLVSAIQTSCNTYFCKIFYNIVSNKKKYKTIQEGYQAWKEHINNLGFGQKFETDLPFESAGIIPSANYFDKKYNKRWNGNTIVSMGIGQGETTATPLQMANMVAVIANKGYYIKPHVVKAIGDKNSKNEKFTEKIDSKIDARFFPPVIKGMEMVMRGGTAQASRIPGIRVAGKTGTAQNPHGKDHSVFVCFAPVNDPDIAVAVIVENAGWGGVYAAPIATLIIEYYLNREIKRKDLESTILNTAIR